MKFIKSLFTILCLWISAHLAVAGGVKISHHSFSQSALSLHNNLEPFEALEVQLLNAGFRLELEGSKSISANTNKRIYNLYVGPHKVCDYSIIRIDKDGISNFILGEYPGSLPKTSLTEMSFYKAFNILTSRYSSLDIFGSEACLFWHNDSELVPVQRIDVTADSQPLIVYVGNNGIIEEKHNSIHLDLNSKIYDQNINDSQKIDFTLSGLTGDGSLTNSFFYTNTGNHDKISTATSDLDFDDSSAEFRELSVFANANRMLDYYKGLGFSWSGEPIMLKINDSVNPNNAEYKPSVPHIALGNGDGKLLQNLATDADVISHEFGHHIAYLAALRDLGNIETVILHEAFADIFTFARTGDPCLGESICPAGSSQCAIENQCLRNADNSFTYDDSEDLGQVHLISQIYSGLMWSLIKDENFKSSENIDDEALKVIYSSLEYLVANSGVRDLVLALAQADQDRGNGNCELILETAKVRGLGDLITDLSCDSLPNIEEQEQSISENESTVNKQERDKESKPWWSCGSINTHAHSKIPLIALMLLPMALGLINRRQN